MPCKVNLIPNGVSGTPNGRWFLTNFSGGGSVSLEVGCAEGGPFTTISNLPSNTIPLDNACANKHNIWLDLENASEGVYTFTFVSPIGANADDCSEDCIDCANFTLTIVSSQEDQEVSYCDNDEEVKNVFTITGVSASDYEIISVTNCTLGQSDCVAANGNFTPSLMGEGTYIVTISRQNASPQCDDCQFTLTISIDAEGDAGQDQDLVACVSL
jgi:hypothetical protein